MARPDDDDGVPPGRAGDIRDEPMPKADKIFFSVVVAVFAVVVIGILLLVRWFLGGALGLLDGAEGGVGWRSAFIAGVVLSFLTMVIFALVGGDGVLGELTIMIVGFFLMLAFFTVAIAVIL